MNVNLEPHKSITAEKAIRMLEKDGVIMSSENAGIIVDFLYVLAEIFYQQEPLL